MSSFVLKIIAVISMLIDHIGFLGESTGKLPAVFSAMRIIGRIALPLYIFMIAEGCKRTRNIKKYMFGLLVFAFISEIPFDLFSENTTLFSGEMPTFLSFGYQNVYFTLFLGVLSVYLFEKLRATKFKILSFLPAIICATLSYFMNTDYEVIAVLGIFIVYLCKTKQEKTLALLIIAFFLRGISMWDVAISQSAILELVFSCIPAFLVLFYNEKRGKYLNKWIFYWFYPTHLAVLASIFILLVYPRIYH